MVIFWLNARLDRICIQVKKLSWSVFASSCYTDDWIESSTDRKLQPWSINDFLEYHFTQTISQSGGNNIPKTILFLLVQKTRRVNQSSSNSNCTSTEQAFVKLKGPNVQSKALSAYSSIRVATHTTPTGSWTRLNLRSLIVWAAATSTFWFYEYDAEKSKTSWSQQLRLIPTWGFCPSYPSPSE